MKKRRRPYVRTILVGSALAFTGCAEGTQTVNPEPEPQEPMVSSNPAPDTWIENPAFEPDVVEDTGPTSDVTEGDTDELDAEPPIEPPMNPAPER